MIGLIIQDILPNVQPLLYSRNKKKKKEKKNTMTTST